MGRSTQGDQSLVIPLMAFAKLKGSLSFLDETDDMKLEKTSFAAGSLNGTSKAYK